MTPNSRNRAKVSFALSIALILAAGLMTLWFVTSPQRQLDGESPPADQAIDAHDGPPLAFNSDNTSAISAAEVGKGAITPTAVIQSIYSQDAEFAASATAAAENLTDEFSRENYLRWQPVHINPDEILSGDQLSSGSVPASLSMSPFPDITVVADMTSFNMFEETGGANWTGSVRGSDGLVEMFITRGEQGLAFTIRIIDPPTWIDIYPLNEEGAYLAIQQEDTFPDSKVD